MYSGRAGIATDPAAGKVCVCSHSNFVHPVIGSPMTLRFRSVTSSSMATHAPFPTRSRSGGDT